MGFSKDIFEQYRREVRIMWRVLAVGAVAAGGVHLFSLPWISRLVSSSEEGSRTELEATPIEVFVEEEVVQQATEPEPEPKENPEPAASAERPTAAPLATNVEPVPISEVASADTVAVAPAIATENGEVDGQGAVGTSSAIGLVPGTDNPTEVGDRINLPNPEVLDRPRTRVQETTLAARAPRVVSCNPCTSPNYPTTARQDGNQGQPVISATYDENGRVISATVEVSSGDSALDQAALEEVRSNFGFQDSSGQAGQVSIDFTYVIGGSRQYEAAQQAGERLTVEVPSSRQVRSSAPASDSSAEDAAGDTREPEASNSTPASEPSSEPGSDVDSETSRPAASEPAVPESAAPEPTSAETVSEPPASEPVVPEVPAIAEPSTGASVTSPAAPQALPPASSSSATPTEPITPAQPPDISPSDISPPDISPRSSL